MSRLLRPLCATLALTVLATTAHAQSAEIEATATVSQQLTASGDRSLTFGTVYPGVNKTVAASDGVSGKFSMTGGPNAEIQFSFDLPLNLDSGANTLAIGTWTGCHNMVDNNTIGCLSFTPSIALTKTRLHATSGALFIFLGATVTSPLTQAPGVYTAILAINASYTGL